MVSPQQVLRGKRFLVTRPEGQGDRLLDGIRALGGDATHIPFLAIRPVADLSALQKIADHLSNYRACIFISANAAHIAWPTLVMGHEQQWPKDVVAAVIGPGTARTLRTHGVAQVIVPTQRFDSEALLAEPYFSEAACHGQAFALIRGEGGRDFLAQSLRARGARVDEAAVYQRDLHPDALPKLHAWIHESPAPGALLISSSESLQRIMSTAPAELAAALKASAVLAPHERIAESARLMGFERVAVTHGGDEGILNYLQTYNEANLA